MDSACSRHMTGDKSKFTHLELKDKGTVSFGDNSKAKIIGSGIIGSKLQIEDVSLVNGLKFNLLSVSQLCDKSMRVIFEPTHCEVQSLHDNHTLFMGSRNENVYLVDLDSLINSDVCLASMVDDSWLWHKRLGHIGMK